MVPQVRHKAAQCLISACTRLIDGVARPMDANSGLALHFVCRPRSAPVNHTITTITHQPRLKQFVSGRPRKCCSKARSYTQLQILIMILDKNENSGAVLDSKYCVSPAFLLPDRDDSTMCWNPQGLWLTQG